MMKASQKGRVRPTILFSQTPHSISRRAKRLSKGTAAELLRHLCELTIGFGRGSVDLTYRALAAALHKDWRTIARAASLLRAMGDVEVEVLENRSYRWYVLLEPEDIVSDPEGIYRIRTRQSDEQPGGYHDKTAMEVMALTSLDHNKIAMGVVTTAPCSDGLDERHAEPISVAVEAHFLEPENEALKISLKDTSLKKHHQSEDDDEPLNYKKILGELIDLGTGQRMARKLLRNHDHGLIAKALERVRHRSDLENRAGYLIREVEDGGYQELHRVKPLTSVSRETLKLSAEPPIKSVGVQQTKEEVAALEIERRRKDMVYRENVTALLQRFQGLNDDLKLQLKAHWTRHLERIVPNTPRKDRVLADNTFQKLAFKEVTARFFSLLDEGLSPHGALAQMAA